MCRTCVDKSRMRIRHQRSGLLRGHVGKTEEGDVGLVEKPLAFSRILTLILIDLDKRYSAVTEQPVPDLESCRTFLTVDKNLVHAIT